LRRRKKRLSRLMANRMSDNEVKELVTRAVRAGETRWSELEESFRELLSSGLESNVIPEDVELDEIKAAVGDLERQFFALRRPYVLD
jgi:protein subunit release factor A